MSVRVTELKNGLTVASDTMPGLGTVTLGAWVNAGTRHETAGVNGIAHLLEHMAFKGTKRRSAFQIAQEIEAVGGYLNAYTGREVTAYYAKVLSEDLALGLDIIGDILQHPVFEESELELERDVVLQEIGQAHDTPDDIVFDHFQWAAYPDQPLGRPVLGEARTVKCLSRANLLDYLGSNYAPGRLVIAAAGAIEHDALVQLVQKTFDSLSAGRETVVAPAKYKGGKALEERDLEQVHLVLGFPAAGLLDDEYYAANLFSTLLGGGMSSRLFQEIREKRGLAYSIYSFNSGFIDSGLFGIYAGTGAERTEELLSVIAGELKDLPNQIEEEELTRAQAQARAGYLMSRESTTARCEQLAQQILTFKRPLSVDETLAKIEGVGLADIHDVCANLNTAPPTLAGIGPFRQDIDFEPLARQFG